MGTKSKSVVKSTPKVSKKTNTKKEVKSKPVKVVNTKDSLLNPIKTKKSKKVHYDDEIDDMMGDIPKLVQQDAQKAYKDGYESDDEGELKPLVTLRLNIKDCMPEEADLLVKDLYKKLEVFNNEKDAYEHKVVISISAY